jgi:hypothetical protein
MKSHYISIWRIFDLVLGVLAKPSFLVRACIFTGRESVATFFDSFSSLLEAGESGCSSLLVSRNEGSSSVVADIARGALASVASIASSALGAFSQIALGTSSLLRYDASRHRARAGLVRSRNPRLFANVNGKELLEEYVEGENAGHSLLSRVHQGVHLSEGPIFLEEAFNEGAASFKGVSYYLFTGWLSS